MIVGHAQQNKQNNGFCIFVHGNCRHLQLPVALRYERAQLHSFLQNKVLAYKSHHHSHLFELTENQNE